MTTQISPQPLRFLKRVLMVLVGPFYFLFIGFVPLICGKRRGFRGWYWRRVKRACSHMLWLLSVRVDMSEADRAALGADTNSVFVINHRSHLDGFTVMDVVPDEKWFTWAAKKELCDAKLLSTGFKGAGLVEIDRNRGKHAMEVLSDAVRTMPARRSVVLFPEGTRYTKSGLGEFKAGAVLVARETGRTIRPIVIMDSDKLLPKGRFWPKAGTVHIKALAPFECDLDASVDEDVARLRAAMTRAFEA